MRQRICLDSGAFSAWKKGTSIDIDEYIVYIKRNLHLLDTYINLDVIPGIPNEKRTQKQVEESARKSRDNLLYMKKQGLSPIPVYHWGEDPKWLRLLLEDKEPYVAIGVPGVSRQALIPWLDRVFTILTDNEGKPLTKVHGLGVFKPGLMFRFPWYSVDATSWILQAANGRILVPPLVNGELDFNRPPMMIYVSEGGSPNGAEDYQRQGPLVQQAVRKFLAQIDLTIVDVRQHHHPRMKSCAWYFKRVGETLSGDRRFEHRMRTLI